MAQADAKEQENVEETSGNGSNGVGKTAVRAAAVAAVSGATALAAKKAFADRAAGEEKRDRAERRRSGNDVLSSMFSSGWDSAKDSLVPMIEDAADHVGEFLAQNGPEIVRDTIVPRFIDGFERARKSDDE